MTSPRTTRRLNRILAMLPWVIANPGTTVDEVCERFGYTRDELVSDLATVFVCGLPGYGPGDLMEAYVDGDEVVVEMADYFARPIRLSAPEALGLLASGLAILATGQANEHLEQGVAKLQAVLLPESDDSLVIDLAEPELVGELRDAAVDGAVMRIDHSSVATGDRTVRDIEPWSVFSALGNWYVSAHCRLVDAERLFRLDRIRSAEPTGDTFEPPEAPPEPVVRYTPNESDVRATIALDAQARWVADYYPVDVISDDEGRLVIGFSVSDASVAARLLVRLGGAAELIDGDEVAAATADLRERILRRYTN